MEVLNEVMLIEKKIEGLFEAGLYTEAENILSDSINSFACLINEKGDQRIIMVLCKLYNMRGQVHYKKVQFPDALNDYCKALEYDFNFAPAYYNRGTIYYRLGHFLTGVKDMEQALVLEPTNEEYKQGLCECQRALLNSTSN